MKKFTLLSLCLVLILLPPERIPVRFPNKIQDLPLLLRPDSGQVLAQSQTGPGPGQKPLYYQREHFVWIHVENDRFKQEDLFPFLSRQRIVIVLEQPDNSQKERVQNFLKKPPEDFPEIDTFQALPSPEKEEVYAIGYLAADAKPKIKAAPEFEAYLVTFKDILAVEKLLVVLDNLAQIPGFDFVLPVFLFPDKMVAPFVQFEVEFLPPELIPGGVTQIRETNEANYVKEIGHNDNFKTPVVLQLKKGAPTNILATVLRYQQMSGVVKRAKLRWLRLRMPVEVQAQPVGINTFGIWEPIHYTLRIERDQDVELLPKTFTKEAVYAWISENTRLPDELIQVDQIEKKTQNLQDGRILEEVAIIFRLSKTGTYILPAYPVQVAYKELNDQKRIKVFRASMYTAITIPTHLPQRLTRIPGQLISLTPYNIPSWIVPTGATVGILLFIVGMIGTWSLSRRSLDLAKLEQESYSLDRLLKTLTTKYQGRLKEAQRMLESLTFQGSMDQEREWLHFLIILLKHLLGERYYQDETHFLGGLGTSSESIKQYMKRVPPRQASGMVLDPDKDPVAEALSLLHSLEKQVLKKSLSLSPVEAQSLLARVEEITKQIL
ncbi:MAG TPA: hypothetical protein VNM22_21890 [Candidatus Limnocylindrales bacterium]|nr:hypothetical protein [Candidatus Limnocylindrales bacterium]